MTTMDPKIKADWLAELRSGEFQQGRNYLCRNGRNCCLGVLTILAERAGVVRKNHESPEGVVQYAAVDDPHDYSEALLLEAVGKWAGLIGEDVGIDRSPRVWVSNDAHEGLVELTELNDGGMSFAEIADLIEVNL